MKKLTLTGLVFIVLTAFAAVLAMFAGGAPIYAYAAEAGSEMSPVLGGSIVSDILGMSVPLFVGVCAGGVAVVGGGIAAGVIVSKNNKKKAEQAKNESKSSAPSKKDETSKASSSKTDKVQPAKETKKSKAENTAEKNSEAAKKAAEEKKQDAQHKKLSDAGKAYASKVDIPEDENGTEVIGVIYHEKGKMYLFGSDGTQVNVGDIVEITDSSGAKKEVAVVMANKKVSNDRLVQPIKTVENVAYKDPNPLIVTPKEEVKEESEATEEPVVEEVTEEPATEEVTEEPVAEEAAEEPAEEGPVAEEEAPAEETSVDEEPTVEEATEEPAAEEAPIEEEAIEEPAEEEPVAEEEAPAEEVAVDEEPASEEPVIIPVVAVEEAEPVVFTVQQIKDYVAGMDGEKHPGKTNVSDRVNEKSPDSLNIEKHNMFLLYGKDGKISLLIRLAEGDANGASEAGHTVTASAFSGTNDYYKLPLNDTFKSEQELYDILEQSYAYVLERYFDFDEEGEMTESEEGQITEEVPTEEEIFEEPATEEATEELVAEEAAEETAEEGPVAEEEAPAEETSVDEEPATEGVTEEPVAEEAAEETAEEEPVAEEEAPAEETSVDEEPASEDQVIIPVVAVEEAEPVVFTVQQIKDYVAGMDGEKHPAETNVKDRINDRAPDSLNIMRHNMFLLYGKDGKISLLIRLAEGDANGAGEAGHTVTASAFSGTDDYYKLPLDKSFKSEEELYAILEQSYEYVLGRYFKFGDDGEIIELEEDVAVEEAPEEDEIIEEATVEETAEEPAEEVVEEPIPVVEEPVEETIPVVEEPVAEEAAEESAAEEPAAEEVPAEPVEENPVIIPIVPIEEAESVVFTVQQIKDYVAGMDGEKHPAETNVKDRVNERTPDSLNIMRHNMFLLYGKDGKISLLIRLSEEASKSIADEGHKVTASAFAGTDDYYKLPLDKSFKSEEELYAILEQSYEYVLGRYFKFGDDGEIIELEEDVAVEEAPEEDEIIEEAPVEETAEEEPAEEVVEEPIPVVEEPVEEPIPVAEEPKTLKVSLALAAASKASFTKKAIAGLARHDEIVIAERPVYTSNGRLPLADTYYDKDEDGQQGACYAFVYESRGGGALIILRSDEETVEKLMEKHPNISLSAFPKSKEKWYSLPLDETYSERDIKEILGNTEEPAVEAPAPESEEPKTLKVSLALAAASKASFTKKSIAKLVEDDDIVIARRATYTAGGHLPLADTYYDKDGAGQQGACYAFVYESRGGGVLILLRADDEKAEKLKEKHPNISLSAFPKSQKKWYSLPIDGTYSEEDIIEVLGKNKKLSAKVASEPVKTEEPQTLKASLALAAASKASFTKKSIAKLAEADNVIISKRAKFTSNGTLPLADTYYVKDADGNKGACYAFVYESRGGGALLILKCSGDLAGKYKGQHPGISKSAFPKSRFEWYSFPLNESYTATDVKEILDRTKGLFTGETYEPVIFEETQPVAEPQTLKASLAKAAISKASFTKESIANLVEGDDAVIARRAAYTSNGRLPLSDNYYLKKEDGSQGACYAFVYESRGGGALILVSGNDEVMEEVRKKHPSITLSAFPKSKEKWYSLPLDCTYSEDDVKDILVKAKENLKR